ncbi:SDR family oxidoreductase [Streptomyces sp. SAJ15]|uniref:SDR family oxidoreductase n=1 Tax=Streptomyces sp. SAJ15 TaxID=2011095 RepID=UPI0028CB1E02|nr:SDR family oxidoreductase [Streptomyces sp. SAJ15]
MAVARSNELSGRCASAKAGFEGLTRVLARELGPTGITANCVAPGSIHLPIEDSVVEDPEAMPCRQLARQCVQHAAQHPRAAHGPPQRNRDRSSGPSHSRTPHVAGASVAMHTPLRPPPPRRVVSPSHDTNDGGRRLTTATNAAPTSGSQQKKAVDKGQELVMDQAECPRPPPSSAVSCPHASPSPPPGAPPPPDRDPHLGAPSTVNRSPRPPGRQGAIGSREPSRTRVRTPRPGDNSDIRLTTAPNHRDRPDTSTGSDDGKNGHS